jgi:hypothetical protein
MWKETKDNQTTYHLRIGVQKFTSQAQTDRNGETYWRYYPPVSSQEAVSQESESPTNLDPITKFNHRQTKTEAINHGKPNSEPSSNSPVS